MKWTSQVSFFFKNKIRKGESSENYREFLLIKSSKDKNKFEHGFRNQFEKDPGQNFQSAQKPKNRLLKNPSNFE